MKSFFTPTVWLLLGLTAFALGFGLWAFPFPSVTPPPPPAHLSVQIDHSVGALDHVDVDVRPVKNDHFLVDVTAVVALAERSDSDRADQGELLLWVPPGDQSGRKEPNPVTRTTAKSGSRTKDTFRWTVSVHGRVNGASTVNDSVLFGVPDVRDTGPRYAGEVTSVARYLVDERDSSALAWSQNSPNYVRATPRIGWTRDQIASGTKVDFMVAEGTDLAVDRDSQLRLFISGALIAVAGGALVAVIPEFARARERSSRR